jgi:autotransporter-associated beta strand protein
MSTINLGVAANETLASITTNAPYLFYFNGQLSLTAGILSTPSAPSFTIEPSGVFTFANAAGAANSAITNLGRLNFLNQSSAASAAINNQQNAQLLFNDQSDAQEATITNSGTASFGSSSTANQSLIANLTVGTLGFLDNASAGQARITNSGTIFFVNSSTANEATIGQFGGITDFSGMTGPITVGEIYDSASNPGAIRLGATNIAIGSLSTDLGIYGVISGFEGSLTKVGTGSLTLNGDNTYTGPTTIVNGTLDVSGSVSGSIDIESGGTLAGTGTVGNATNSGTIVPSATLTVTGSLQDLPFSATLLNIDGGGISTQLSIAGTATLDGALFIGFPGEIPTPGTTYVLIDSSAIVGTFSPCTTDTPGVGTLEYSSTQVTFSVPPAEHIFGNGFETPTCD